MVVITSALIGFIGVTAVKVVTTLYVRHDNNKEFAKMQLNVPLLEHVKLDREQLARSEAAMGFNECPACRFENFNRTAFCIVCGEPIGARAKKRAKKAKVPNTLHSRSKRASKRKEWVRVADAQGLVQWVRQVQANANVAQFPGFVVVFQFAEDDDDLHLLESQVDTGKTESLIYELKRVRLQLVESSKANPWAFPVGGGELTSEELRAEVLRTSSLDFPSKNAVFVAQGVAAIAPTSKQLLQLSLDRSFALEHSFENVSCIQAEHLRAELAVKFLNKTKKGPPTGKMNREWISQLSELLVGDSSGTGLFRLVNKADQTFYLNRHSKDLVGDDHLTFYFAAGRLLGKGLLDGNMWGFHLATPLLKIILGQPVSFTDLEFFDPEEYKNLEWLVKNSGAEALGLDFSVTETVRDEVIIVDLIPNGRNIPVTDANKMEYLERRFQYTLFESVSEQLYTFLKGIYEVVPQEMLMVLDPEELDFVMCGSDVIDADDWQRNAKNNECIYGHSCMRWFWKFVRNMPLEYKKRLLHFTTGSTRVPIGGFAALTNYSGHVAPFTILGNELVISRLIRGVPCFNQIELPNYTRKRDLKAMLFGILDNYEYASK